MKNPFGEARGARYIESRVQRKGLRPRFAAELIAVFWVVGIVVFGIVEHLIAPERFNNVWLGMWWATQTVTTVGYGDTVPQGTAGQIVATLVMIVGLSLFSVITATITSAFVARAQATVRNGGEDPVERKLDQLAVELDAVRGQLDRFAGEDRT
jgi:voltage-gated potassium channel Kch